MKNVLGDDLDTGQQQLVECYQKLVGTLREHGSTLQPYERRNALKAAAALWQVMNGLDMEPGQLYDIGA